LHDAKEDRHGEHHVEIAEKQVHEEEWLSTKEKMPWLL